MKTNLFDLTGKESFCCATSEGPDDIQKITSIPLYPLLIYPRSTNTNKSPYLQNPNAPIIEDFYTEDGQFDFSKSVFLSDMLTGNIDDNQRDHLQKYFRAQLGILSEFDSASSNIILVPDNYDAEKQEKLLRCCGLPRNKTLLLWRSVAICLGAEDELSAAGVKEGDKIAIIDAQAAGTINISILTMKYDGDKLVPARSSFNKREKYPVVDAGTNLVDTSRLSHDGLKVPDDAWEFWAHTWQRNGEFFVPEGDSWTKRTFEKYHRCYSKDLPPLLKNGIDFYVFAGDIQIDFIKELEPTRVICEKVEHNFSLKGAGRFSVRNANSLPTYFDECESLYFIIQDLNEEKVIPRELIKGNEFCRGGQEIIGVDNRDFVLPKDYDVVSFLMHVGNIDNSTHLRELKQEFGKTATEDQPLILSPSMIPGQGIARVIVKASPLLRNEVELDFLKMSPAYDGIKPKTINYLQETLPRSYPIDFPETEASVYLWNDFCREKVSHFMSSDNESLDGGCFAYNKKRISGYRDRPNTSKSAIDVYKRINVFGTRKGAEYPIEDKDYLHEIFKKIAVCFKKNDARVYDYIRLAAWTYRCGIEELQCVVDSVLDKVKKKVAGESAVSLKTQEFTVCANMLSIEEQTLFFQCFNKYVDPIVIQARKNQHLTAIENVYHWIRALMWILIYSNELLKHISTSECNKCMYNLYEIWKNYIQYKRKQTQKKYVRNVICCMLFLLRRRKYDHNFLRKDTTPIFEKIMKLKQWIEDLSHSNKHPNAKILQQPDLFAITESDSNAKILRQPHRPQCDLPDSNKYPNAKMPLGDSFFEYLENKGRLDIPMEGILDEE